MDETLCPWWGLGAAHMTMRSVNSAGDHPRGKSGRPPKAQPRAESGHNTDTAGSQPHIRSGAQAGPLALPSLAPVHPRLLDLHATAAYLGVSEWTIRDLEGAGVLPRVRLPLPNHKELRKILFDVHDLDRLIDTWKEQIPLA